MEDERIASDIENGVYIKGTDVSVGIKYTITVDEGDWEDCDYHNDSEDSAYIVVASGDTIDGMEIGDTNIGGELSDSKMDVVKGDTIDVTETGDTDDNNGSDEIIGDIVGVRIESI